MDAQGRDAAGQPYTLPQQQKLSQAVFTGEVGADTDMIDGHDAGVVWYSVDGITPARDRTLDEARGDVVAAWTTEEKAKRLKAKADEALKALEQGKSMEDEAKELGVEAKQAWNLKRNGDTQGLSAAAVNLVFATPVKGYATALSGGGTDRIVFEVTDSTVPPFDPAAPQSQQMAAQLGQLVAQDLLAEYIGRLQNDLGTSINQTNVNRAIGAGTEG
jgi:peptidyl-prolyl cis-trans isomerase D